MRLQFWLKTPLISDTVYLPRAFFFLSWLISFVFCLLFVCSFLLSTLYAIYCYGVFPNFLSFLFFSLSMLSSLFHTDLPLPSLGVPPPLPTFSLHPSVFFLFLLLCSLSCTVLHPSLFSFLFPNVVSYVGDDWWWQKRGREDKSWRNSHRGNCCLGINNWVEASNRNNNKKTWLWLIIH